MQYNAAARNAGITAMTDQAGSSPILELRTGAPPASPAAAATGVLLATITLPAVWLTPAADGVRSLTGLWQTLTASGAGTVGHFRLIHAGSGVCVGQGNVTLPGGGGVMTMTNPVTVIGEPVTITSGIFGVGGA